VEEFSDQKIYIGGEVTQPSIVKIAGRLRILDAIIQAEGTLDSGDLSHVILMRHDSTNAPKIYYVNVKNVLKGLTPDIWLKPYDIVYVPKTDISNIETFIRTHLWDLLPSQVVFSFLYNWNNEVQVK
jgi:protein involved in polysaccharide export with SLBB domain